jgi:hypothetical protein
VSVSNSTAYVASFWYRASGTITVAVREFGRATNLSSETLPTASEWTRYTKSVTTLSSGSTNLRIVFTFTNGAILEIDAAQVETGTAATPYCDGSLGVGHTWSGSAHASTSTRSKASLRYPVTGNISASKGTIMAWFYADAWNPNGGFIWQAGNANGEFDGYVNSAGNVVFRINGTSLTHNTGALAVKTWHHAAFTWDVAANERIVYVNGVAAGSTTTGVAPTLGTVIDVGNSTHTAATSYFSGYIDDFCILDRVAPANEIRAIYESNAPVFAETSTFSFRPTPKGLLWADDEGLWMRDTSANPVFGIYGGDATKSWGGFTMSPGDLLIGNNAVGSSAILWDQSAGTFGFYGGGGTVQVEINTDGTLYAGTAGAQRVQLSSAELAGYNSSNVKQWYGSTSDGKLYAGAGNVTLDATGIKIKVDDTVAGGWNELKFTSNLSANDYFDISSYRTTGGGNPIIVGSLLAYTSNASEFGRIVISAYGLGAVGGGHIGLIGKVGIGITNPSVKFQVAGSVTIGADDGGLAGYITYTNASNLSTSTGTGTVKLTAGSNRDSNGWVKIYVGATAYYIPVWSNIS